MKIFRHALSVALLVGLVAAWLPGPTAPAMAVANNNNDTYICHLDGGSGKYSKPNPAPPADILAGHDGHAGDIIPPLPTENYPGKNWDSAGQLIWNNDCKTPVTPAPVTFTVATCADPNATLSYTIPKTEGVKYMVEGKEKKDGTYEVNVGDTITVTAELKKDKDNFFPSGVTTSWTMTFTEPDCTVTPAAVTFTDPTCSVKGTYTIPATEHVGYKIGADLIPTGTYSANNGTAVTVDAVTVDTGYSFDTGVTTTWSKNFTAPTCATTVVAGASTTTPTTTTQVSTVPVGAVNAGTGNISGLLAAMFGLLASIGATTYGFALLRKQ